MHNYCSFLFYFLIVFSLSCNSLSPSTLFLLYLLKSNKKFIQIIKIFKFILNLDPKFIRPSLKKKKKKIPSNPYTNQTQNAEVKKRKMLKRKKKKQQQRGNPPEICPKSLLTVAVKSTQNHHPKSNPNCKSKIIAHSETQNEKEEEEWEEEKEERRRKRQEERKKERKERRMRKRKSEWCGLKVGRVCKIIKKMWEKYYLNKRECRINKLMWVLCKSDNVK